MAKRRIGEICESLDFINMYEDKLKNGDDLDNFDRETIADLLSQYADVLLGLKVEI